MGKTVILLFNNAQTINTLYLKPSNHYCCLKKKNLHDQGQSYCQIIISYPTTTFARNGTYQYIKLEIFLFFTSKLGKDYLDMIKAMSGLARKHLATMPPGLDKHENIESRTEPHVVKNQNQNQNQSQ